MPKSFFIRTVVIVLVIGILAVAVPTLKSAERKLNATSTVLQILKQPLLLVSSLFPASTAIQMSAKIAQGGKVPAGRVRPTGDSPVLRPGTGD